MFTHFTCVVLQQHKFHYYYSKLQYKKLSEIKSPVVSEENKNSCYDVNLFL